MFRLLTTYVVPEPIRAHLNDFLKFSIGFIFIDSFKNVSLKLGGVDLNILQDQDARTLAYLILSLFGMIYFIRLIVNFLTYAEGEMRSLVDEEPHNFYDNAVDPKKDTLKRFPDEYARKNLHENLKKANKEERYYEWRRLDIAMRVSIPALLLSDVALPACLVVYEILVYNGLVN